MFVAPQPDHAQFIRGEPRKIRIQTVRLGSRWNVAKARIVVGHKLQDPSLKRGGDDVHKRQDLFSPLLLTILVLHAREKDEIVHIARAVPVQIAHAWLHAGVAWDGISPAVRQHLRNEIGVGNHLISTAVEAGARQGLGLRGGKAKHHERKHEESLHALKVCVFLTIKHLQ